VPGPVVVVDYDPAWPDMFERFRDRVAGVLEGVAIAIEHVGSTAVPGLAAKPIIDMDVVVPSPAEVPEAIRRLARLGYVHKGDLGIPGRAAFRPPADLPHHHLYVCAQDSPVLRNHLAFRDYLRSHPDTARRYDDLKRDLARRYRDDREAYTEAKTAFITGILRRVADEEGPCEDRRPCSSWPTASRT